MGLASKLSNQPSAAAPVASPLAPQPHDYSLTFQGANQSSSFHQPPTHQMSSSQPSVQMGRPAAEAGYAYQSSHSGRPFGGDLPPPQYGQPSFSHETSKHTAFTQPTAMSGQAVNSGILASLRKCVADNRLESFYPEHKLQQVAAHCSGLQSKVNALCSEWGVPNEMAYDLYKLALYDIIMLCDDSGSMIFEEQGERVRDLEVIISYVAKAAALFDTDGISVRFLNSNVCEDGITEAGQVSQLIKKINFSGLTPLGTVLESKIIQPFFFSEMQKNTLTKPLLVIIITDGCPAGEPRDAFERLLLNVYKASNGGIGISIAVAQVGTDQHAQRFLADLDTNKVFGKMLDVTSNYELEQEELKRKGVNLTPELWICKLVMGAIDPSYDEIDE